MQKQQEADNVSLVAQISAMLDAHTQKQKAEMSNMVNNMNTVLQSNVNGKSITKS